MTELRIGDQSIRYDRERTAAAYETIRQGDTDRCGCIFCKNFAAQRNRMYPPSFLALLEQLGIDPNKEAEAFECGPAGDGCRLYGGWFYLVGEMVAAGERNPAAPDAQKGNTDASGAHHFEFFFATSHPNAGPFAVDRYWPSNSQRTSSGCFPKTPNTEPRPSILGGCETGLYWHADTKREAPGSHGPASRRLSLQVKHV